MLTDASLLIGLGRLDEADRVLSEMLDQATAAGDQELAGRALEGLGAVASERGQEAQALQLFEQAIERGDRPDPVERESLYTHTRTAAVVLGRCRRGGDADRGVPRPRLVRHPTPTRP